ncbi:dicer-like protein 2-1 [Aspergillus californicus]
MASVRTGKPDVPAYRARSYQLEMYEASLKSNIIVAMGTGSGKTHMYAPQPEAIPRIMWLELIGSSALLRIIHELENSHGKLIWFLAPTVALCLQQHKVILQHIPAAKSRTITGLDKVELWTEQAVWDVVLKDVQVVISTHAVLVDAMTHGFVRISQLGLIIFDEAHHCVRKHPANRIMRDFYHPALGKLGPDAVPRILGLTASAGSSRAELDTIEANLSSTCTTPQLHRHELLEHTHKPELHRILFTPIVLECSPRWGGMRKALQEAWGSLDLENDPYVKKLRSSPRNMAALEKVLSTGKTYCNDQLKRFVDRATHIHEELGIWAADYFIWVATEQLRAKTFDNSLLLDLNTEEKSYLVGILSQLPVPDFNTLPNDPADFPVSPKFEALLSFLLSTDEADFSGLIFAQQRATVAVMAQLLSVHPYTRDRFRTGGFVGMSTSTNRKDILGDLLTAKTQRGTLDEFRGGKKNLIVATDVLEEGIDVSACSVVVCYNRPPNLKSFVQRRGRARRQHSTYAILLSTEDDHSHLHKWHDLEKVMEEAYQDDQRHLDELRALETINEDVDCRFCVEATGAMLTGDNAVAHLFHFCSTLPRQSYVDTRPEFSFERDGELIKGKVTLSSCVHPSVRRAEGKSWWKTERAARKEAAFQSYKALHEHGLVNNNLLPLTKSREFTQIDTTPMPSIEAVSEQYDPWVDWAYSCESPDMHQTCIVVRENGSEVRMKMISPTVLPLLEPMNMFWDSETTYTVEFEAAESVTMTAEEIESMRTITALYLKSSMTRGKGADQDFITLFAPDLPQPELLSWLHKNQGHQTAQEVFSSQRSLDLIGVVRDTLNYGEVLIFKRWVGNDASSLELECESYPKRRNLLQQQTLATKRTASDEPESPANKRILPADSCTIDRLPATETIFGRFIPVIVDRLEAALVATKLCETILRDIPFTDLSHVITAITMPLTQAPTNYQRYEFFGDSVLKFTTSVSLYCENPTWHEGYLSTGRDAIVQNPRLTRAALYVGLDTFIISKMFTPRKWSAPLISQKLQTKTKERELSTKVLADVVEALIGAAYLDGGHEKAQACMRLFLPELHIIKPDIAMPQHSENQPRPIQHDSLEANIGYRFNNKTYLIEALTHPSCQYDNSTQSYQRLEFLGDAVLDMLIIDVILRHPRYIQQGDMTRIKHAVVNANLLAFLCMEFSWVQLSTDVIVTPSTKKTPTTTTHEKKLHLYSFMRTNPATPFLVLARNNALERHSSLSASISDALKTSDTYPWLPLSKLNADKFFSDIIESTVGAIFVDAGGDLDPCLEFVNRLGLVSYLTRILDEGIDVVHPVQKAQILAKSGIRLDTKRVDKKKDGQTGGEEIPVQGDADADGVEDYDADPEATYTCTVTLTRPDPNTDLDTGLEGIVVRGCLSREEAEVRAASLVVDTIQGRVNGDGLGRQAEIECEIEIEGEPSGLAAILDKKIGMS